MIIYGTPKDLIELRQACESRFSCLGCILNDFCNVNHIDSYTLTYFISKNGKSRHDKIINVSDINDVNAIILGKPKSETIVIKELKDYFAKIIGTSDEIAWLQHKCHETVECDKCTLFGICSTHIFNIGSEINKLESIFIPRDEGDNHESNC